MNTTDHSSFNNDWYEPNAGPFKRLTWYLINALLFNSPLLPVSSIKTKILEIFGAKIGKSVVVKPNVNIKYPWNLSIGDYSWIGENVWIDNLDRVTIGSNVCISQGAMLLCGNHDISKSSFDLLIKPITILDGAWIGAKSVICPGSQIGINSVVTVGSVAKNILESNSIYKGNPAIKVKERQISL